MSQLISVDLVAAAKLSADVPPGYTDEGLKTAVVQYEKFLMLAAKNRRERLVPTKEIDMMWHLHMLHPRAYYNDCMDLFGDILDHNGGYGLRLGEAEGLAAASDVTMKLWEQEFSEGYLGDIASCRAGKATDAASCMADGETLAAGTQLASCGSESEGNFPGFIRFTGMASCRADKATDAISCMSDGETLSEGKQLASCGSEGQGNFPGLIRFTGMASCRADKATDAASCLSEGQGNFPGRIRA